MHRIDKLELLANLCEAGREADDLLAEPALAPHSARLRRIIAILGYMREHLEMVNAPLHSADRLEPLQVDRQQG
jgi:hypothetical protein